MRFQEAANAVPPKLWGRPLAFAAKAALSIGLLYLCLRSVDLKSVLQRVDDLDLGWMGFVLTALFLQALIAGLRWQQIVVVCGAPLAFGRAFYFTMVGIFFNQALPSTVGGDAVRVYLLKSDGAGWRIASYSVFLDRAIGLFFLTLFVTVGLPWSLSLIERPLVQTTLILLGLGGLLGGLAFLSIAFVPKSLTHRWWLTRHLAGVAMVALQICLSPRFSAIIGSLSIVNHLLTVAAAWGAAKSIGAPLSFVHALVLVPPVMLVATIPVSIAGWGVREGLMLAAFGYAGLPRGDGLIVSVIIGLSTFVVGVAGAVWWLLSGKQLPTLPTTPTQRVDARTSNSRAAKTT